MEKNKKKIKSKKIIFVCLSFVLIFSVFAVSIFATNNVYTSSYNVALVRDDMSINYVGVYKPTDYHVNTTDLVSYNDLGNEFYNYSGSEGSRNFLFKNLKQGTYINYPLQTDSYSTSGRVCEYTTSVISSQGFEGDSQYGFLNQYFDDFDYSYAHGYTFGINPSSTITAPNTSLSRNMLSGREIVVRFDDFLASENITGAHCIWFLRTAGGDNSVALCQFDYTYVYVDTNDEVKELHQTTDWQSFDYRWNESGTFAQVEICTYNNFSKPTDCKTDEFIIKDFTIRYQPLGYSDDDDRLAQVRMVNTAKVVQEGVFGDDNISDEIYNYISGSKFGYIVESIGDVSLTDWLETAIGGFFDFEIVPNVSLGGLLLLTISVGVVMLLIRIFRG